MQRTLAKEVLIITGVALAAALLLLVAGVTIGLAFMLKTYVWAFGVLYGVRIIYRAIQSLRVPSPV